MKHLSLQFGGAGGREACRTGQILKSMVRMSPRARPPLRGPGESYGRQPLTVANYFETLSSLRCCKQTLLQAELINY